MLNESEHIERKPFGEMDIDPDSSMGPLNNSQRIATRENEIEMAVVTNKQANEILDSERKSKRSEKQMSEMQSDVNTDAFSEGQASIDTIENYVGPVKEKFDELKAKIEEKENELLELEKQYYTKTSKKQIELEGITDD